MTEKIESELISRRRALSLLGLAAAFGLAVPPTVLTVSDAEAQYTAPAAAPQTGTVLASVTSGAQVATSGVTSGAQVATSGVRSGAQVARAAEERHTTGKSPAEK